jgi:dTDP-3-amino-3,4,6-trideoxy-alpha-D-glucose transaminase
MQVPLFATSLEPHRETIAERLAAVAGSGRYILGPEVAGFESEFADYLGVRHVVGVANGTDALTIALRALGVEPGDEVICPSLTFYATAEAIVNARAVPVFCDVDPDTWCVTAETVRPHLTERTRAIVPVHLFGNVAPVDELRELGARVLEDAAQAAGAALGGSMAGALGDAATFSFFPSKNLPCLGDGGAVVTDDDAVAERVRTLRFHGSKDKQHHTDVGYNSRLDEMQAAVLRILLPELDGWNEARRHVADRYRRSRLSARLQLPAPTAGARHVYHLYTALAERADELVAALAEVGIGARGYYRTPAHRQPAMRSFARDTELPVTDRVSASLVAVPMGPLLDDEDCDAVVAACERALA